MTRSSPVAVPVAEVRKRADRSGRSTRSPDEPQGLRSGMVPKAVMQRLAGTQPTPRCRHALEAAFGDRPAARDRGKVGRRDQDEVLRGDHARCALAEAMTSKRATTLAVSAIQQ